MSAGAPRSLYSGQLSELFISEYGLTINGNQINIKGLGSSLMSFPVDSLAVVESFVLI